MLHLVGCLYYLYQWFAVKEISDNEIYLLIKYIYTYIKFLLWRVAKHLSYIEDARCLKVKLKNTLCGEMYRVSVPLATEPGISLKTLPLMRILKRNLKRTTDTFLFISNTTKVLLFKFRCNILIGVRIIKEMPGSVASGTLCIFIIIKPAYICTSLKRTDEPRKLDYLWKNQWCQFLK